MGVDVFKSYHADLGILDTSMYDHDLVYGVSPGAIRIFSNRRGLVAEPLCVSRFKSHKQCEPG